MSSRYLTFVLWVLCVSPRLAATQTVIGVATDDGTGRGVEGASVMLVGLDGGIKVGVLSDSTGRFALTAPRAGRYTLRSERIGFRSVDSPPFDMVPADTVEVEFRMSMEAVLLAPLTITGRRGPIQIDSRLAAWGFYDRRAEYLTLGSGTTHFIDIDYIRKRAPNRVTDLFRDLHGVRVIQVGMSGATVQATRKCGLTFYLDGVRIGSYIDEMIVPSDLAAIEVYAGAPYPAQYAPKPRSCGSVVVWTGWVVGK